MMGRTVTLAHNMEGTVRSVVLLLGLQVKPEAVNDVKGILIENLPDTRGHDGCQGLDVYDNMDETGNLVIYERGRSCPEYEEYLAGPTETEAMDRLGAWVKAPPGIRYFERVQV